MAKALSLQVGRARYLTLRLVTVLVKKDPRVKVRERTGQDRTTAAAVTAQRTPTVRLVCMFVYMNMRDKDTMIYRLGQLYVVRMHAAGLVVRLLRNYCYVLLQFNIRVFFGSSYDRNIT